MHVYSSKFYDYVDNNPYVYYFYTCLIKEDMLESAVSDMLSEASGGLEHSQ